MHGPVFLPPDIYHEEERNQSKLPEDIEDQEIKSYKDSYNCSLHSKDKSVEPVWRISVFFPAINNHEWDNYCIQQDQGHGNSVNSN